MELYLAEAQPWWENGASTFWIIIAALAGLSWVVGAWRGRSNDDE